MSQLGETSIVWGEEVGKSERLNIYLNSFAEKDPFDSALPPKEEMATSPNTTQASTNLIQPPITETKPNDTTQLPSPQDTVENSDIPFPPLSITGIVWNTDRPQAIINGKIVELGDKIDEVQIVSIDQYSIVVLFHDQYITLNPH